MAKMEEEEGNLKVSLKNRGSSGGELKMIMMMMGMEIM